MLLLLSLLWPFPPRSMRSGLHRGPSPAAAASEGTARLRLRGKEGSWLTPFLFFKFLAACTHTHMHEIRHLTEGTLEQHSSPEGYKGRCGFRSSGWVCSLQLKG